MSEVVQIPVEVADEAVVFRVVPRGYDRGAVDARVAALEQELAELRWEHDELAAQRRELVEQRAEQERWAPSFTALGERAARILRLAEEEAAALRGEAAQEVQRREDEALRQLDALLDERTHALAEARRCADREMRTMAAAAQSRREMLDAELSRVRRDAELEVAGRLAQASAQAKDTRAEAVRAADELLTTVRAEVVQLQRRRDELVGELTDLSRRLVGVVQRLDRTDEPIEVSTG